MHKNFALLAFFRWVVAHPGLDRQGEKATVDVHLERLYHRELILVAVALVEIQVVVAFFFARDVCLSAYRLRYVVYVARRHEAVAQAGVQGDLLGLHLDVRPVEEAEALERDGPTFRFFDEIIPYDIVFC